MPAAGQVIRVGRIPNERIATEIATSASATFTTTEIVLMTLVAPLVAGRTYLVGAHVHCRSTVDNDDIILRIREDAIGAGGSDYLTADARELTLDQQDLVGMVFIPEVEFPATITGPKTFVLTGERLDGTGICSLNAASNRPAYFTVDYITG